MTFDLSSPFWRRVDVRGADECWPWRGSLNGKGYGRFKEAGTAYQAHREALRPATGVDIRGWMVCHACDNPPCCNPKHLWRGTALDNNRDRIAKGRTVTADQAGEANGNRRLREADVDEIRFALRRGATNTALGERYGVTHSQISNIRRGLSWTHVVDIFA